MKPLLFVRPLTREEALAIRAGLRSPSALTLRRCQILSASAAGLNPSEMCDRLGCSTQTVRNAIRAFEAAGIDCLGEGSHRPKSSRTEIDDGGDGRLRALLHRGPRDFGKPTSLWTLDLAAEVAFAEAITARRVSHETIRRGLQRLGVDWKRAKAWITSPDPAYLQKNAPHSDPLDPPRRRANQRPGHGTMGNDRPPIAGVLGRGSGLLRLRVVDRADGPGVHRLVGGVRPPARGRPMACDGVPRRGPVGAGRGRRRGQRGAL